MKWNKLSIFVLFLILSIAIIGCSGGGSAGNQNSGTSSGSNTTPQPATSQPTTSQPATPQNEAPPEEVELVMYSWRAEDRGMYEKAIAKFNETYPHIQIDFQPYQSTEYNTILTNALMSGSAPDILQLRPYASGRSIADNGYLLPLDNLLGLEHINEQYFEAAKGSDGKIYGVPLTLNSGTIFYNKDLFEAHSLNVPETWEEFVQVSQTLKDNGIIPIAQGGRAAYLLSLTHGAIAPTAYNGNEFVDKVLSGQANLTDPAFVESVKRMETLGQFFPQDFVALDDASAQTLFYTGEAAMYINGDYRLATLESTAPDMNIGVIPGFAAAKGQDPIVTTWVDGSYAVSKDTKHPEEALLFMEFMTTEAFGQIFTDELNRLSAVKGVQPKHPIVNQITAAIAKSTTPYLLLVHFGEGEPTTKTVFENALQGMYLGEITVDQVIQQAQEAADRAAGSE